MNISTPRILGVRLHLYPFWLLAFALLAVGIFAIGVPGAPELSVGSSLVLGLVGAFALIVSYALHELSHGVAGRAMGMPIEEVGLFAFVDRAQPPPEPPNGRVEALSAIAGVIVSLLIAAIFGYGWVSTATAPTDDGTNLLRDILWWVTIGNLALGVINGALAYPYDGGRVVRGLAWMATRDKLRATRIGSAVGRAFSVALMFAAAIWALLTGDILDPIWLFIAGLFLLQSSRRQVRRLEIRQAVEGLTVSDVMDEKFDVVGPNLTIDTLHDQHERRGDVGTYPVTADGELLGSVDIGQIERIPRTDWGRTRVGDVMTTLERLQTITRRESVMDALLRFEGTAIDAIPVVDEKDAKHIIGLVTRERLIEKLRPRVRKIAERDRPAESGG